jgi:hypothetical protein
MSIKYFAVDRHTKPWHNRGIHSEVLPVIPDDDAHCNGEGCDARGGCLRYVALLHKESSPRRKYWIPEDPKSCPLFIEVRKDEMVSATIPQPPRPASAKVRQAVSAIPVVGGATAK